jgi:hypothetical protein
MVGLLSPILIVIYAIVLAIIFIAALITIGSFRTRGTIARALNISLFSIILPRESKDDNRQQKSDKDLISIMEQLYSSFTNMHAKGWNKFIYGEPYLSLEMAVHQSGEEIHFYVGVPKNLEEIFDKQVHGIYPYAEVSKVKDYNIFNSVGVHVAGFFRLKENSILPFRTYQKLESDPLGSILTALSKIDKDGEGAAIQLLIRPSHKSEIPKLAQKVASEMQSGFKFSKALSRAKKAPKAKPDDKIKDQKSVTPFDEEIIKSIQNKATKPLFDTNVRIIVSAREQTRADQLFNEVVSSFVPLAGNELNKLDIIKVQYRHLNKLLFNYAFRIFNNNEIVLLSCEELTSLYHFPLASTSAPKVKFLRSRPAEPPVNLPNEGIVLGINEYRGQQTEIRIPDEDRRRHLYVIGQTGTGKTTLLKALLRQDIENGKGLCLIDPHGEFTEFALGVVPKERIDDVIYFDPGDISRPMGLNMLEVDPSHPEQKSMVIDELFGIFDKLYDLKTTGGPMFEKYFKNSALLLMDAREYAYKNNMSDQDDYIPVLADVSRVLVDDAFRAKLLTMEDNPLVKQFWQLEAEKAGGDQSLANMAPYISSKITSFVFNEFLRPIINQPKSAFNFREVMDKKKILIVNLSKGKIGDLNGNLLGMVIIGKLLMAALSRVDIEERDRTDFYLYIDEFQNFTTDSISVILSEARKYRLDLIIAHQFIKQLKDSIRDAVFGNVGSMAILRVGADDAEYLKNKFEPVFTPQDLMNIDNLNAYVSLILNNVIQRPFNIRIQKEAVFGAGDAMLAKSIAEMSKLKYGRPREEVENEIKNKFISN